MNLKDRDKIKDDAWYTMYGDLVTKYEAQFEANEKMRLELLRRQIRYQNNQHEYRE